MGHGPGPVLPLLQDKAEVVVSGRAAGVGRGRRLEPPQPLLDPLSTGRRVRIAESDEQA